MFVPKISYSAGVYNSKNDNVSFSGLKPKPEILKERLKIMLTQDIWAEKLSVKMPENDLEKDALLEILNMRRKLDRFTRLSNEKFRLLSDMKYFLDLAEKEPNNPEVKVLAEKLAKRGNLDAVLATLNKNIELEASKNKPAIEYFKNIAQMEEIYFSNKFVKTNELEKFLAQIRKNNINKEKNYTTQDLIDIVSGNKILPQAGKKAEETAVPRNLSKNELFAGIRKDYEQYLRENVNIYMDTYHSLESLKAQDFVFHKYNYYFTKTPKLGFEVKKVYNLVENIFSKQLKNLGKPNIFPVGDLWREMDRGLNEIKHINAEIANIKRQLADGLTDEKTNASLARAEKGLAEIKKMWSDYVVYSVACEAKNREIFEKLGKIDAYDYLTGANRKINRCRELAKICEENNGELTEEIWTKLLRDEMP